MLAKIYLRTALAVLPVWMVGLYAIEALSLKVFGFPVSTFFTSGIKYQYEPVSVESILLMALAIVFLLRRAVSHHPDRAFFIEIPLTIFLFLYTVVIHKGMYVTFQNYRIDLLYLGVQISFVSAFFLLGILIGLASHWNRKFCRRPPLTLDMERCSSKVGKWRVVGVYVCTVIGIQLLHYGVGKLALKLSSPSHFWSNFFSLFYSYTFFMSGIIDSILEWMHLSNVLVYLVIVSILPFILIAVIVFFLFRRVLGVEPRRVYRVEIPLITLICVLLRMVNFVEMYSTTVISVFSCMAIMLIPPVLTGLWTTMTAYGLIQIKNRLQL